MPLWIYESWNYRHYLSGTRVSRTRGEKKHSYYWQCKLPYVRFDENGKFKSESCTLNKVIKTLSQNDLWGLVFLIWTVGAMLAFLQLFILKTPSLKKEPTKVFCSPIHYSLPALVVMILKSKKRESKMPIAVLSLFDQCLVEHITPWCLKLFLCRVQQRYSNYIFIVYWTLQQPSIIVVASLSDGEWYYFHCRLPGGAFNTKSASVLKNTRQGYKFLLCICLDQTFPSSQSYSPSSLFPIPLSLFLSHEHAHPYTLGHQGYAKLGDIFKHGSVLRRKKVCQIQDLKVEELLS